MVKKVMKSNEKRAGRAENAERRHRNLILAAVALTAAVAIVSLVLFIGRHRSSNAAQTKKKGRIFPCSSGILTVTAGRSSFTAANPVQFGRTFRKNRLCLHGTVTEY